MPAVPRTEERPVGVTRIRRWLGGAASLPLHSLLLAAYPVLFLFTVNIADQLGTDPLWRPLAMAVCGAALVLLVLARLVGDWHRAGLLTTVMVIGFFGYGHAWNVAAETLETQWPLIGAWALAVMIGLVLAWRARPSYLGTATSALNLVALLLVTVNLVTMVRTYQAFGAETPTDALTELELDPGDGELPNVYYVILDRYAGATALRDRYDFDNEPFLTALEERGFAVAREAHANYIKTPLSLVSSLNMEFLDAEALRAEAESGRDREPIHRILGERLVVPGALKELGYEYIQIGNWWTPTATNVDADRTFVYEGQDEFSSALSQTTILRAFSEPHTAPDDPWDWAVMRENNMYALDRLDETTEVPGPKYVFAHLVTTHPPYVHNADGSFTGRGQVAELGQVESYTRQLTFANSRMLGFVDRVLRDDPGAIVVLAADEGPFPERYRDDEWGFDWEDATDAELEEKFGILFAMRVPGADLEAEGFHDSITPVNTFRIIFNARFGTDLELLPDRTWAHENLYNFYDMFEITDRLRR